MEDGSVRSTSSPVELNVSLGDVVTFLTWMDRTHQACEQRASPPSPPDLGSERMKSWVHLFEDLYRRNQDVEQKHRSLTATLQAQEQQVARLLTNLYEDMASLYDNLGQEDKAIATRNRAASCVLLFRLREPDQLK